MDVIAEIAVEGRLHMDLLILAADDVLGNGAEPCLEVGYRISVRVIVIDSKSTSEVYVIDCQPFALEVLDNLVYSLTLQRENLLDSCDLRADMEMQAEEVYVFTLLDELYELVELMV